MSNKLTLFYSGVPDVVLIYLFLSVLPLTIVTGSSAQEKKRKRNKFTIKESQNSFILHLKNAFELNEKIDSLRKESALNKTAIQPFIIALGDDFFEEMQFYTFCDGVIYSFDTAFISTLDCCFKMHFVFNLKYAEACSNFWYCVQHQIFDIEYSSSKILPSLLAIYEDLKN